jgi:hypothetical protein
VSIESERKVAAIYDLRKAVEQQSYARVAAERDGSSESRDALLDATLDVEAKTALAIDVCNHCGRPHADEAPCEE